MLSDDAAHAFNDAARLQGFFNQGATFYRQFGIARVRHEVWNRRELTDRIVSVKVNWFFADSSNKPIYSCDYHYVMKLDKNDLWKVVLSVSVNEKQRLEEWQAKNKRG